MGTVDGRFTVTAAEPYRGGHYRTTTADAGKPELALRWEAADVSKTPAKWLVHAGCGRAATS
jgi:hypothetical protein